MQLLHLPDGWEFLGDGAEMLKGAHGTSSPLPRLTNKVEFVAPPG